MVPLHTVFIVNEQAAQRRELAELLRLTRYTVVGETGDGDVALEKVPQLRPSACIIDVNLRHTDSLLLLAQLRRRCPETVLFASALASQAPLAMAALTLGAADILLRPFGRRTLANTLMRHLR